MTQTHLTKNEIYCVNVNMFDVLYPIFVIHARDIDDDEDDSGEPPYLGIPYIDC